MWGEVEARCSREAAGRLGGRPHDLDGQITDAKGGEVEARCGREAGF